jgi:Raf kinase inhibitor-like YbhB/YbcL family protein
MNRLALLTPSALLVVGCLAGCRETPASSLSLSSKAFLDGGQIPAVYTCDGLNVSPPLAWGSPPAGTVSVAVIVDDPDARAWAHWVLFNLPGWTRALPEGIGNGTAQPGGGTRGRGDGGLDYFGPCPPVGDAPHRYSFRVYALDAWVHLAEGATRDDLVAAMGGHILAQGELTGLYGRQAAAARGD